MANSEDLARHVASITDNLVQQERQKGKDRLVPPPPKKGEFIICQQCGKPMLPEDFSKDPKIRKHEFKWHIHHACEENIWDLVDRQTPGLVAERKNGVPSMQKPMHLGAPKNGSNKNID